MNDIEIRHVQWIDSTTQQGWEGIERTADLVVDSCASIGFVFKEDEDQLILIQSYTNRPKPDQNLINAAVVIPKFAITRAWTVREGKPYYAG